MKIFDDHLSVDSPGILPGLVKTYNIREMHFSRNPKIAKYMHEYEFVKEFGEGVDRMFREMEAAGQPEPKYRTVEYMVKATLWQHSMVSVYRKLGPINANADPINANADPIKANADPIKANADPIKANADPIKANADPINADADPIKADADPINADADPIKANADPINADADPIQLQITKERVERYLEVFDRVIASKYVRSYNIEKSRNACWKILLCLLEDKGVSRPNISAKTGIKLTFLKTLIRYMKEAKMIDFIGTK